MHICWLISLLLAFQFGNFPISPPWQWHADRGAMTRANTLNAIRSTMQPIIIECTAIYAGNVHAVFGKLNAKQFDSVKTISRTTMRPKQMQKHMQSMCYAHRNHAIQLSNFIYSPTANTIASNSWFKKLKAIARTASETASICDECIYVVTSCIYIRNVCQFSIEIVMNCINILLHRGVTLGCTVLCASTIRLESPVSQSTNVLSIVICAISLNSTHFVIHTIPSANKQNAMRDTFSKVSRISGIISFSFEFTIFIWTLIWIGIMSQ